VENFYACYNLSLPYGLELKNEHIADKFLYLKKADHAILNQYEDIFIKSRGVSKRASLELTTLYQIVQNVFYGKDIQTLSHKEIRIISMEDYFQSVSRNEKLMKQGFESERILIPGYYVEEEKRFHLSISELPYLNEVHYKWRDRYKKMYNYEDLLLTHSFAEVFESRLKDDEKVIRKFENKDL
jgi:hypothetical protein